MSVTDAEVATATARGVPAAGRPFPPSWLNLARDWLNGLPVPRVVPYAALAAIFIVLGNAALWVSAVVPAGQLDPTQTLWACGIPVLLAAIDYLDGLAGRTFDDFRPALGPATPQLDGMRYRLTVMPARPAVIIAGLVVPLVIAYYLLDPIGSRIAGYSVAGVVLSGLAEWAAGTVTMTLIYHTLRRLTLVTQLLDMATQVDIFRPRPLYAFSRLTAQTGVALMLLLVFPLLVAQPAFGSPSFWILWAPWFVLIPALGTAAFVLPLLGTHRRLSAERERLQDDSDHRLRTLLDQLNAALDSRDLASADGLQKLLEAHQVQRETVARLPTWPWSGSTLRGFASALVIPTVLFLIQRLLVTALGS